MRQCAYSFAVAKREFYPRHSSHLEAWQVAGKPENSDEDLLFFFPETDEGR
jgi:hypothetical protein